MKEYYRILGIKEAASQEQIKRAYRRLAKKWHPDLHRTDKKIAEERFKKISEAYSTLSKPDKRKLYDLGMGDMRLNNIATIDITKLLRELVDEFVGANIYASFLNITKGKR